VLWPEGTFLDTMLHAISGRSQMPVTSARCWRGASESHAQASGRIITFEMASCVASTPLDLRQRQAVGDHRGEGGRVLRERAIAEQAEGAFVGAVLLLPAGAGCAAATAAGEPDGDAITDHKSRNTCPKGGDVARELMPQDQHRCGAMKP
jgi:hypothetical protein